ncbi:biotin--[acetyl-CoA-carboxylase] ligase [Nocardia camponoti]|uniref:biotin--[biotin carboxyl-carrier protein] ligase n=1 Tax=Nocardia camponoti TaxID=1616106 RepID=A0A917QM74_9NOCA|nr:biotin--[acetyl-CoA-carboxylase] ligase [Nocardia camponoti]GGK56281.1 putative biotin--acetyl-CoA-carboxylase ligase (BirA bifunctional protein) [Nocardia camponoti]
MDRAPIDTHRLREFSDGSSGFFRRIDVVDETGSTNADLVALATADPSLDRVALLAEEQVKGRGRHARAWSSPPRAQIAMSMLVRLPGIDPAVLGWLPLLTGVAVVDALRESVGVAAELKWPNDVLLNGRKLAGILAEVAAGGANPTVVVGVGLNVDLSEAELPVPHAISLRLAGASTDRTDLAAAILRAFGARFTAWQEAGWSPDVLAEDYRNRCATIGLEVRAELPGDKVVTGVATGVDESGRLLIGDTAVSAGDVSHLRGQY